MGPSEAAEVAFIETLKTRHETLKAQLAAAGTTQDGQHAAKITAELQEIGLLRANSLQKVEERTSD